MAICWSCFRCCRIPLNQIWELSVGAAGSRFTNRLKKTHWCDVHDGKERGTVFCIRARAQKSEELARHYVRVRLERLEILGREDSGALAFRGCQDFPYFTEAGNGASRQQF